MHETLTTKEFIENAKSIHGDKYNYSLVEYGKNNKTKVKIICQIHGTFEVTPNNHIIRKSGCAKCYGNDTKNTNEFIIDAKKIHGNKYDYSLTKYSVNNKTKVKIICQEHGMFEQKPNNHLMGHGCGKCFKSFLSKKLSSNKEEFVLKSNKIHLDKYDYSLVEYKGNKVKVKIICFKHGIFKQSPNTHLVGKGCLKCKSSKAEEIMRKFCKQKNILLEEQKTFDDCKFKGKLKFDGFLPEHNILIELDGKQHFESVKTWGGKNNLIEIQQRDKIKTEFAETNGIKLIRIPYTEFKNIEKIIEVII